MTDSNDKDSNDNDLAGKHPRGIILGGSLIQVVEQLEDPIEGLPSDLLTDAARTVACALGSIS